MRFPSKKDLWLGLLLWIPIGAAFLGTLFDSQLTAQLIMFLMIVFVAWIWFGTSYEIAEGILKAQCGPFRSKISIKEIKSIKKTRNPLSSFALSLDRLEIRYGKWGMILISPKDRDQFIELISKENEEIRINV